MISQAVLFALQLHDTKFLAMACFFMSQPSFSLLRVHVNRFCQTNECTCSGDNMGDEYINALTRAVGSMTGLMTLQFRYDEKRNYFVNACA